MKALIRGAFVLAMVAVASLVSASAGDWQVLGQGVVDFRTDPQVINAKADTGAVGKIKLYVEQKELEINSVKIVFANGESQDVTLKQYVAPGHATKVIDINGGAQTVQRVELTFADGMTKERLSLVKILGAS